MAGNHKLKGVTSRVISGYIIDQTGIMQYAVCKTASCGGDRQWA